MTCKNFSENHKAAVNHFPCDFNEISDYMLVLAQNTIPLFYGVFPEHACKQIVSLKYLIHERIVFFKKGDSYRLPQFNLGKEGL